MCPNKGFSKWSATLLHWHSCMWWLEDCWMVLCIRILLKICHPLMYTIGKMRVILWTIPVIVSPIANGKFLLWQMTLILPMECTYKLIQHTRVSECPKHSHTVPFDSLLPSDTAVPIRQCVTPHLEKNPLMILASFYFFNLPFQLDI